MDFPISKLYNGKDIYLHGLGRELQKHNFSRYNLPKSLRTYYYWIEDKKPINLEDLKKLLSKRMIFKCLEKTNIISAYSSPHKIKIPKKIDKNLAYLCGYHMGDGSLSTKTLTVEYMDDISQLEKISRIYDSTFGISLKIKKCSTKKAYNSYFTSRALAYLLHLCLELPIGRKERLFYPSWINAQLRKPFVVGFLDAEFGIGRKKFQFSGSSVDKNFLKKIQCDLESFGLSTKLYGPYKSAGDPRPRWFLKNSKKEAITFIKRYKLLTHPVGLATLNTYAPVV